jgi:hypothetical protein
MGFMTFVDEQKDRPLTITSMSLSDKQKLLYYLLSYDLSVIDYVRGSTICLAIYILPQTFSTIPIN